MKKTVYLLMLCMTGILLSCLEDEGIHKPEDVQEKSYTGYKRSIVSFQDMKAKFSQSSSNSLTLFSGLISKGGNDYIQTIDSTYIIQYSNDTLSTYTMHVSTLDDENYSYSNLIIRMMDGQTEAFIAHYSPTEEWQTAHDNGEYLPYQGIMELFDTNGNSVLTGDGEDAQGKLSICYFALESEHVDCYGTTCPCTDGNGTTNYKITLVCSGQTGGGSNPPGDSGSGAGGGSGSGSGSSSGWGDYGPGLPTDPTGGNGGSGGGQTGSGNSDSHTAFDIDFLGQLTTQQINWLNTNPAILSQVYNYLQAHGQPNPNGWYDNDEAVQFALWAIDFLMENSDVAWTQFEMEFITFPPPIIPITDIQIFLSCFDIHQSANLTVYAQKMFNGNGVGHAFISITQGNNTRTFGFYPKLEFPNNTNGPGIFGNDSGHHYTYGWNIGTITPLQLQQIIGDTIAFSNSDYNVLMNNCSDFANYVLQIAGTNCNASGVDTPNTIINLISNNAQYTNGTAP